MVEQSNIHTNHSGTKTGTQLPPGITIRRFTAISRRRQMGHDPFQTPGARQIAIKKLRCNKKYAIANLPGSKQISSDKQLSNIFIAPLIRQIPAKSPIHRSNQRVAQNSRGLEKNIILQNQGIKKKLFFYPETSNREAHSLLKVLS